jgi:hypothetical protein
VIRDGLAPNKRLSLSAHDEPNGDSFHIWLMAEPAHRKRVPLPGISSDNNLDTGPKAYRALWSPDSHHVAVSFRSARHVQQLNLYRLENGRRARPIAGPSLFEAVTGRAINADDDIRMSVTSIDWRDSRHFRLSERRIFHTTDPDLAHSLRRFGRNVGDTVDGKSMVEFSAVADCILVPDHSYRIVDLKVGTFGDDDRR